MPRPTLLADPDRRRRIIEAVREALETGAPITTAIECGGIHHSTHYAWMAAGDEGLEPYREYSEAVRRARTKGEVSLLAQLRRCAEEGEPRDVIKASTWLLERVHPDKYGASLTLRKAEDNAIRGLLERLRERLDPGTLANVIAALADDDSPGEAEGVGPRIH